MRQSGSNPEAYVRMPNQYLSEVNSQYYEWRHPLLSGYEQMYLFVVTNIRSLYRKGLITSRSFPAVDSSAILMSTRPLVRQSHIPHISFVHFEHIQFYEWFTRTLSSRPELSSGIRTRASKPTYSSNHNVIIIIRTFLPLLFKPSS